MNKYSLNKKFNLRFKTKFRVIFLNDYNKRNKDNEDGFDWIDKNKFLYFLNIKWV
jgi:hypothetical protein